jgi:hypothetical protein
MTLYRTGYEDILCICTIYRDIATQVIDSKKSCFFTNKDVFSSHLMRGDELRSGSGLMNKK